MKEKEKTSIATLHVHTVEGDGLFSFKSLIERAIQNGFSVIGFFEHDNIETSIKAKKWALDNNLPIQVAVGVEITSKWFAHIVGIFPTDDYPDENPEMFKTFKETADWIHQHNGLVIIPHPILNPVFWFNHKEWLQEADGIELLTWQKNRVTDIFGRVIEDWVDKSGKKLAKIGAPDLHHINGKWKLATEFKGEGLGDLRLAIINGTTKPVTLDIPDLRIPITDSLRILYRSIFIDPSKTGRARAFIKSFRK